MTTDIANKLTDITYQEGFTEGYAQGLEAAANIVKDAYAGMPLNAVVTTLRDKAARARNIVGDETQKEEIVVKVTQDKADAIARATRDAYSFSSYGPSGWRSCCRMLALRGFNAREIEAIMRSKWTRWAGDESDKQYGKYNADDLKRFLNKQSNLVRQVRQLVRETF